MRKFFLFALLVAATTLFAETKVETFTTESGGVTSGYYMAEPTTLECAQASWTVLGGGIKKNVGNMGSENYSALFRAKRTDDTFEGLPYIMSDSIEGGIDSLWFTWNSNGKETGKTWNVHIYINDQEVGAITEAGAAQIAAGGPFNTFSVGSLNIQGKFVIKLVNEFDPEVAKTSNVMRMVIDDLSWNTIPVAGEKTTPEFAFAEKSFLKMVDAEAFTNALTNTSDATPAFESSDANVVSVDQNGLVTIVGVGTATITASIAETETYKPAEAAYTVRVVPMNFHMETFDGAENVDLSTNSTYLTTATESFEPSKATGLKWTTLLGSVRNALGGSATTNNAAAVRAKKSSEENYGYIVSSTISGGIDELAFDWNANGSEASRQKNWDIVIYINGDSIGEIKDKGAAIQPMGSWFRFEAKDLKIDGDFTIKIVNKNEADDGKSNHYRFVVDNIEWISYEKPCEGEFGIMVDGEKYIAGEYNAEQTEWLEYKIVAELEAKQTFKLYDNCAKVAFLPTGQEESGYQFNVEEGVWSAPHKGTYTIYLKMYGMDNNWIWTSYEAPFYTVTITEPTNGTLVVMDDAFEVKTGGNVQVNKVLQIIPTPDEGYQVASVTANGDKIEPQEGGYYYMMSYVDVTIAATFEEACAEDFGIMVDGEKYIAGVKNVEQTGWLEYKIEAALDKDQTLTLYDNCAKASFLATQEEGGYWFTVGDGVWIAPAKGQYTIYLKMYGPDNNVVWTACEEDVPSGIENAALKADVRKAVENGVVVIYRNGVRYNLQGQEF